MIRLIENPRNLEARSSVQYANEVAKRFTYQRKSVSFPVPKMFIPFAYAVWCFLQPAATFHIVDQSNGYLVPFLRGKKIVTCHDIIPLKFPEYQSILGRILYSFSIHSMKSADAIVTVSAHTKKDLVEQGFDEDKIFVNLSGIDHAVFYPRNVKNFRKFTILAFGRWPYKNLDRTLQAAKKVGCEVIVIGKLNSEQKKKYDVVEKVHVSDSELAELYCRCHCLVFPSLYEGFGKPPVEAMACGTPVIVSDVSSLPEVVGDAGILVNPYSVDDIACAIENVKHAHVAGRLSKKGLLRAKKFTWESHVSRLVTLYQSLK